AALPIFLGVAQPRKEQGKSDAGDADSKSAQSTGGLSNGGSATGGNKRIAGAPTISTTNSKKRQPKPASIGATYREISIGEIQPNPKQPRTVFDDEEL